VWCNSGYVVLAAAGSTAAPARMRMQHDHVVQQCLLVVVCAPLTESLGHLRLLQVQPHLRHAEHRSGPDRHWRPALWREASAGQQTTCATSIDGIVPLQQPCTSCICYTAHCCHTNCSGMLQGLRRMSATCDV
jgi:hypothetical protein